MPPDATIPADIPGWAAALLVASLLPCLVVGPHLLALARRTRCWPELALGFFATGVAVGNIGQVAASRFTDGLALVAAANLVTVLGSMAFYVATWRVYRAGSPLAAAAAGLGALALLAGWAGRIGIDGAFEPLTAGTPSNLLLLLARSGPFAWWAAESLAYAHRARRQEALGLASAGTAHRFTLWGVTGVAGLASLGTLLALALAGRTPNDLPVTWVVLALGILVAAAAGHASFFWPTLRRPATRPDARPV